MEVEQAVKCGGHPDEIRLNCMTLKNQYCEVGAPKWVHSEFVGIYLSTLDDSCDMTKIPEAGSRYAVTRIFDRV